MKKPFIYTIITLSVFLAACEPTTKVSKEKSNTSVEKEINKNTEKSKEEETKGEQNGEVIYQGELKSVQKTGSGTVSVIEKKDGKRILKLTNFKTSSGPDLYVYFFKTKEAKDGKSLKDVESISLGTLKSISGDQEYEVPSNINLDDFQAVSIWCEEFTVNFAAASLSKKS